MTDSELQEKLKNDFRSFRIEYDNRVSQKYVEKQDGKRLSTEDFTTAEKNKLASLTGGAAVDTSQFATKDELQLALSNVTVDTSNLATKDELQEALENVSIDTSQFVLKEDGKGLSTEDFTSDEKNKLSQLSVVTTLPSTNIYISEDTLATIMASFVG